MHSIAIIVYHKLWKCWLIVLNIVLSLGCCFPSIVKSAKFQMVAALEWTCERLIILGTVCKYRWAYVV